ncbi:MAG: HAMP domain-containing sensor histidine kinase [Bacteroidota bacterium]
MNKENSISSIEELQKLLEQAEKDKAALLKIVSHDLRSPMNKIFALMGLFKMAGDMTEEQQVYLNKMEVSISDALNRLSNLMDLRAIEGQGIDTLYETFDLGKLLKKIVDDYRIPARRKEINISLIEEPVKFNADRQSIQRIMDQLLANAIKFSPTKSEIRVELDYRENDVLIHVIDGGYGIKEEEQQELFKKFTILSTRPTGGESSSGLGLFIAQWMAMNIGGEISYNNENGSRFSLRLPKVEVA